MLLVCVVPGVAAAAPDDTVMSALWSCNTVPTAVLTVGPERPDIDRPNVSAIVCDEADAIPRLLTALPALPRRETTVRRIVVVTTDGLFVRPGFATWLFKQPEQCVLTVGAATGMAPDFMAFPLSLVSAAASSGRRLHSLVDMAKVAVDSTVPVVRWGSDGPGQSLPPLHVSQYSSDPRQLADSILFFSGLSQFAHAEDLRNAFRIVRGEPSSPVNVMRPYPVTDEVARWIGI